MTRVRPEGRSRGGDAGSPPRCQRNPPGRASFAPLDSSTASISVTRGSRSSLRASSSGTGELIRAAVKAGAERVILGLGGSATVDGGLGLCRALGVAFRDASGAELPPGGRKNGTPHTAGTREYLTCEAGNLELAASGEVWKLAPGDMLVFRGDQQHTYRNPGKRTAVGVSVVAFAPVTG